MPNDFVYVRGACRPRSSRSSVPPPSCGSCPAATAGSASRRSRVSWTCPRAPCTGSCARWPPSASSSRTSRAARTSSAPRCCTWAARYLDGNELRTRALNWSDSLASRSGESVRIGTLHDTPRARRPPRLPARRQPPGARGRRAAARPRDARSARCCWPPTATRRPSSPPPGLQRFTAGHADRLGRARRRARSAVQRARLGGRRRGARGRRRLAGRADPGPPRRHRRGDRHLGPRRAAVRGRASRGRIWCRSCARRRVPCRATSARSRGSATETGRKESVSERYIASVDQGTASSRCLVFDRAGRVVVRQPGRAPPDRPRAPGTSSTTRSRSGTTSSTSSPRRSRPRACGRPTSSASG